MRIVSWNVQRAVADDEVWNVLLQLDPDIALLQEVRKLPEKLTSGYSVIEHPYRPKKVYLQAHFLKDKCF